MIAPDIAKGDLIWRSRKNTILSCCFLTVFTVFSVFTVFGILLTGCAPGSESSDVAETGAERGRAIYGQSCQTCHGDAVTGAGGNPAVPPHGPQGHTWHHPDGQLEAIILGQFTYPGRTMPSFGSDLSQENIADILAYIKEGWTTEQREVQAETSRNWEQYQNDGR